VAPVPGADLPRVAPAPDKRAAHVTVQSAGRRVFRGEPLAVAGRVTDGEAGGAGPRVDLYLAPAGGRGPRGAPGGGAGAGGGRGGRAPRARPPTRSPSPPIFRSAITRSTPRRRGTTPWAAG